MSKGKKRPLGKAKKLKDIQHASDHHNSGPDKPIQGEIRITGPVQVVETESAINQHHAERKDDDGYKKHTKGYETSSVTIAKWMTGVTTLYLLATTLIFWESKKSAEAAESAATTASQTLEASQKQFRNEQRPYIWADVNPAYEITAKSGKTHREFWRKNINGTVTLVWTVTIKNGGRSPAQEVISTESETRIAVKTEWEKEIKEFSPKWATGPSLLPSDVPVVIQSGPLRNFSTEEMRQIQKREIIAYVIGAIKYRDIFDPQIPPYETRFCYEYIPFGMPIGTCPIGNTIK